MMNGNGLVGNNINPFVGKIGTTVKLFIFTPAHVGTQVIRPYVYNFDQNTVSAFLNTNGMTDTFKRIGGFANSGMTGAILPSMNGINIDTAALNSLYSFVLVIDAVEEMRSFVAYSGPRRRTVLTGYFVDEPLNQFTMFTSTPTINPNALMIFTHNNSLIVNSKFGEQTVHNITINAADDIVPQALDAFTNTNLSLCDISSLTCSFKPDGYSEQSLPTGYPLNVGGHSSFSPVINDRVKSPKHQLLNVALGIDTALSIASGDHQIMSGLEGDSLIGADSHGMFIDNIYAHLQRPHAGDVHQGINPAQPLLLSDLTALYPNIDITPCQIPFKPEYDIRDQRDINLPTVFSSLVSNSVSSYATTNLLSSISFRYSSWASDALEGRKGHWEITGIPGLLIDGNGTGNTLEHSINKFIQMMESSLFPILLKAGGEFDLAVSYDATGTTSTDLFFLDYSSESRGYYQTHNRFGGMLSPAIGTQENANHNRAQFDRLISELASNGASKIQGGLFAPIGQY